ncbi:Uncharacterised protein [Vibrio cholerae]|nr:Uncharacterised protein [Vibrio cholerae]
MNTDFNCLKEQPTTIAPPANKLVLILAIANEWLSGINKSSTSSLVFFT